MVRICDACWIVALHNVAFARVGSCGVALLLRNTISLKSGRMVVRLQYATHGYMTPTVSLDKFYTEEESGTCYGGIMCTRHRAPSHGNASSGTYPFATSLTDGQANLTDLLPRLEAAHNRRHPAAAVNTAGWRGLVSVSHIYHRMQRPPISNLTAQHHRCAHHEKRAASCKPPLRIRLSTSPSVER